MVASLNGIALDDSQTIWTDEYAWTPIGQSAEIDIHGGLVVEYLSPNHDGRPITLNLGWIRKTTLSALEALRNSDPQEIMTLTLPDGRTFDVLWRHHDSTPIDAQPVTDFAISADTDFYEASLRLMEVSS